ncbi:O-phosphoseryl-tRNA(Sec) selenium transferase-like [Gordionus sp. m RMFG-2023]|uniref:O-phosphoseryl-tRNA(Sec) selenium transferase-like n=1 Tax=Gordionus sp. m RMFG-2023 TaxID=3053472 RepID=UPI0031FD06A7
MPDLLIENLLYKFSLMDSNNFISSCPIGEREARIYSPIVSKRHFNLGHGMGRSGDLNQIQPKATGSSSLAKLTNLLIKDAFRIAGLQNVNSCIMLPVATGMTLTLCFLTLRKIRPLAKFIIFMRIDQKSCFKSIITAGFIPIIVQGRTYPATHVAPDTIQGISENFGDAQNNTTTANKNNFNDEIRPSVSELEEIIEEQVKIDPSLAHIACVLSTTSCFAPRGADDILAIGMICSKHLLPHVVNNAYGLNSSKIVAKINQVINKGARIDCMVQSCDKNFMVPVGGAIATDFTLKPTEIILHSKSSESFCSQLAKDYPGRASLTPSLDIFITLLSLGSHKYSQLFKEQTQNYSYLKAEMENLAKYFNERILETPNNPISIAMTLNNFIGPENNVTQIGAMMFQRRITGARIVVPGQDKSIEGYTFQGWGSHINAYSNSYMTVACTLSLTKPVIDAFVKKLQKILIEYSKTYLGNAKMLSKKI